ncbi:competence/damage-inducible protein A [candidate division WOR-3 bacterium JGI_Cruoil_03_51_56]|uniref:CinA-like protein n=1 Tax=candidate division WOR-3 bacterium JGI_Cruoil_03_51_56 TaxID=1973747 RepID=A0A235BRP5_UNCW3|nr:MAG: competence/damage-inducible protein A [candidate division WOR-3 bacterium JGI_Cruoil_03_51_56]
MRSPRVELVVIGDELISGRVVDTNSAFVSRALADIGLVPDRIVKIGDDLDTIKYATSQAVSRSDIVFVLGGLGPTPDDKTMEAVSESFGWHLFSDRRALNRIGRFFKKQEKKVPSLARRQALVPQGAVTFDNPVGMVPGMAVEYKGTSIILLPGVPIELKTILTQSIMPFLKEHFQTRAFYSMQFRTFGIPEATIASRLKRVARGYSDAVFAYYPRVTGVDVVIRAKARRKLASLKKRILGLLGSAVYEVGQRSIEEVLGKLLRKTNLKLATAESCTGGLISDMITNVPGSSDYYQGGVIAYSNAVKMHLLGVKKRTLERYGAVSNQTVREMAKGVCIQLDADVGIAVSGIAGPGGATQKKPVGLVYIGVAVRDRIKVGKHRFNGNRMMVKQRTAMAALDLCRRMLETD